MTTMRGRREGGGETLAALAVLAFVVGLCVAAYLYVSAFPIENDCLLAGDAVCVASIRRIWMAAGVAGVAVVSGLSVAMYAHWTNQDDAGSSRPDG